MPSNRREGRTGAPLPCCRTGGSLGVAPISGSSTLPVPPQRSHVPRSWIFQSLMVPSGRPMVAPSAAGSTLAVARLLRLPTPPRRRRFIVAVACWPCMRGRAHSLAPNASPSTCRGSTQFAVARPRRSHSRRRPRGLTCEGTSRTWPRIDRRRWCAGEGRPSMARVARRTGRLSAGYAHQVDRCHACSAPIVCVTCEACAMHCMTPGGPDACWEFVEKYRREHAPGHPPPEKPRWPPKN